MQPVAEDIEPGTTALANRVENGNVPAVRTPTNAIDLIAMAIDRGTPVAELKEIMSLHERIADRTAAQAFAAALAAFRAEAKPIRHSKTAKIATKSGGSYEYTYAELDEIARTVDPILATHGLSYGWDMTCDADGKMLTVVCTLRHELGHSKTSSFTLPVDNPSAMSPQQKMGAATTFAQRRSLSAVLGITTTDDDTDAAEVDPATISADQAAELDDLIAAGKADRARFLKYMNVQRVEDIRAVDFAGARTMLRRKVAEAINAGKVT